MKTTVQSAVLAAQLRSMSTQSSYQLDCLDLALDELVRHPDRTDDPDRLLNSALANARKHVKRRSDIVRSCSYDELVEAKGDIPRTAHAPVESLEGVVFETANAVTRSSLKPRQQGLLLLALVGYDAAGMSAVTGDHPQRVSEQLSRARSAAREQVRL